MTGKNGVGFSAGADKGTVSIPLSVSSGGSGEISLEMAAGRPSEAAVSISWRSRDGREAPASIWQVAWDATAKGRTVMDASGLEANPFKFVAIRHELSIPAGGTAGIPFRLRSPVGLRFEYYDESGRLVGVDANGNGDFTESGDYHTGGAPGEWSAVFPPSPGKGRLTATVLAFAPDGKPLAFLAEPLVIDVETYRDGAWIKESEDLLR